MAELTFGISELRRATNLFNNTNEGFNQRHSVAGLLAIYRAHRASEWDFYPDQWTQLQVNAALDGYVPQWQETEREARPIELLEHGPWQEEAAYLILDGEYPEVSD